VSPPLDRRTFLLLFGAGFVGSTATWGARRLLSDGASALSPLGVQLYTVRQALADDVPGTLAALAEIGYEEVETAGLYGLAPADFRRLLDGEGLRAVSGHVPLESLVGEALEATLDDAEALGQHWVTVPWLGDDHRTADGYRRAAAALDRAGEAAARRGMRVAYHNHDFEFEPLDEAGRRTGWELLLQHTDPDLVDLQMDLFWTVHAGSDPIAWFERHAGRFPMVHAKDRTASGEMVDVGAGAMDFGAILSAGRAAGLRHVFVEHDRPADPLASVRRSYETLASLEV
jgi:sugar phosphate isomerase/epimerase